MEKLRELSMAASSLTLSASTNCSTEVPDDNVELVEMQYLFEKVLMPSDMSKVIERLVIPGEHIGKLDMVVKDPEGFVAIVFEDGAMAGKLWRFRYWNRNSVHCLTKGWGSFVREKGLGAGDTVSFFRGAMSGRLFIFSKHGARTRPRACDSSSASTLRQGLPAPPPAALARCYLGQMAPASLPGAGALLAMAAVPPSTGHAARFHPGSDIGVGASVPASRHASSSGHAWMHLGSDVGGGALERHAPSSQIQAGSRHGNEVDGGGLARQLAPSSEHAEVVRPAPPRRRRRSTAHLEPVPTVVNPTILESMLVVDALPPPPAKRVRLFGVFIDGPPPPSAGQQKEESFI